MGQGAHGCGLSLLRQERICRGDRGAYLCARYENTLPSNCQLLLGDVADNIIDPVLKGHLWFNPYAKHFSAMKASDLVLVDPEGYVVEGGNQAVINTAGFVIHSAVHNARPDVHAACHVHSMYGKTWSAFGKPVEMLTQGESLHVNGMLGSS